DALRRDVRLQLLHLEGQVLSGDPRRLEDAELLRRAAQRSRAERELLPDAAGIGAADVGGRNTVRISLLHEGKPRPDLLRRGLRPSWPGADLHAADRGPRRTTGPGAAPVPAGAPEERGAPRRAPHCARSARGR